MGLYDEFYKNNPMYEDIGGVAHLKSGAYGATGVPGGDVANATNTFMAGQARQQYEANLPDYANLTAKRSANTGSLLRGEVPQDVQNQIINTGAERGVATGSPGSPNANAAWLRALGLTSLGLQQTGSQNLTQSIADTPVAQLYNPASAFVPAALSQMGLNAAQKGLNTGAAPVSNWGGAPSYSSLKLPGGTLGGSQESIDWWNKNPSWAQGPSGAVGATGPFDVYSASTPYSSGNQQYGSGAWLGGNTGTDYGNLYGGNDGYGLGDDWTSMFD